MSASALITAKLEGRSFEQILHAVRGDREDVSNLSDDHLDFLESMLDEVQKATEQFSEAIKTDDLEEVKRLAKSFQEIFQMVEDSCEPTS